jgi:carbamoyl-phosphate synthase small subunit
MSSLIGEPGFLLLEDGTLFHGTYHAGKGGPTPRAAEVVFTTNMSGYQEVFTDPSYRAQIVVMTAPMIGNYGANNEDPESEGPQVAGVVVRELSKEFASWRADGPLGEYLSNADIPVLEGVDTAGQCGDRCGQGLSSCVPVDGRARPRNCRINEGPLHLGSG